MRRIGNLSSEQQAHTFQDYLLTEEIDTQVDQSADAWSIWVLDEDDLEEAQRKLAEFEADPQADKYVAASTQAETRRQARLKEDLDSKKRQVNMRGALGASDLSADSGYDSADRRECRRDLRDGLRVETRYKESRIDRTRGVCRE